MTTDLAPAAPTPPARTGLRQRLRTAMAAGLPRRLFLVRGPGRGDSVALTFDDGPDPEHTPRLLDALRDLAVPATFFVIGEKAERHPEVVRRIVAEGHTIGHHTYTHSDPDRTPARQLLAELRRTADLLDRLLGERPRLFRPPYGKLTPAKLWGAWRAGLAVALWNVDPKDYACRTADEVRARLAARPLAAGDVVLMHDNHPHAAAVVPDLVRAARARGLAFTDLRRWAR